MRWFFSNDAPIYTQLIEQIQVGIGNAGEK